MEDFYLSQALFRTQEILDNFTNERSMQVKLKALTENGRIEKIKNGLYATVNSLTGDIFASRFEIASALFENACVAYHSALEFHGLGNQMFSEVQVFTEKRYNPFMYNGLEYKFFSYTAKGGIMRLEQNAEIVVTNLERTIVDCIDRIDLAGGLEELVTALNGITHLDEQALLAELKQRLAEAKQTEVNVDEFLSKIKYYVEAPELTREMCYELIDKIVIGGHPKITGTERVIDIVYKVDINSIQ